MILIQGFTNPRISRDSFIAGTVLTLFGMGICCLGCCCFVHQTNRGQPLMRAVEEESKKYEAQHCQWRLISKKDEPEWYVSRRDQVAKFHVS